MRRSVAFVLAMLILGGCAGSPATSPGASLAPSAKAGGSQAPATLPPPPSSSAASAMPTDAPVTPAPSGPVLPTTEPTGPSWTPQPAEPLLIDTLVYVNVDRLNIREKPATDAKILGVVKLGDFLWVTGGGPFRNDGYTWYHAAFVAPAGEPPIDAGVDVRETDGVRGWIAVGDGGTSYVKRLRLRCATTIDLVSIQNMLGSELLACFGGHTIELTGTYGCSGCGGLTPGSFEPGWLASPMVITPLAPYPVAEHGYRFAIIIRFPPDGQAEPPVSSVIRVRGHFDDPAAQTCEVSVTDPLHPRGDTFVQVPAAAAQLECAQHFVVEGYEILGTDPGFLWG